MKKQNLLQKIFSIQNVNTHKIFTLFGIKLSLKSKKLVKRKFLKSQKEFEETILNFSDKKLVLYFDHSLGGGTETYFKNRIKDTPNNTLVIRVQYLLGKKSYKVTLWNTEQKITINFADIDMLFAFLDKISFDKIVLNNIVGYPKVKAILDYMEKRNCCLVLKVHDFYSVCPSWTLLNKEDMYCGIPAFPEICKECYKNFKLPSDEVKNDFSIIKWRDMWGNFIKNSVDTVEIFSPSGCRIFLKVYPFAEDKIKLVPHKIKSFPKYNIAILGNLAVNKGAKVIKALLKYLSENNICDYHFILIGINSKNLKSEKMTVLGEYKRDNLMNILNANNIDAIFIPSVCPETFSYTTAEAIMSGYPVMCFALGGQADQVSQYARGKILSSFDPQIIEKEMKSFLENVKGSTDENSKEVFNKR